MSIATLQLDYQGMMNEKLSVIQASQVEETEKLKDECDKIKAHFNLKIRQEFVSIGDHEKFINLELQKAAA